VVVWEANIYISLNLKKIKKMIPITLRVFHFYHSTRSRTKPEGCTPKTGPSKSTITNCMMKRNSIRGNLSSMRHTIITPFPSLLFKHFAEKELSTKTQALLSLSHYPSSALSLCLLKKLNPLWPPY
jgi:hypothetical protein